MEEVKSKVQVTLYLPAPLHKRLKQTARDHYKSNSDLAHEILAKGLDVLERAKPPLTGRTAVR